MIQANCREKFTHEDFTFIVESLGKNKRNKIALTNLLTDDDSRDRILDDGALFKDVTQKPGFSKISPYLYFYILVRKALLENDIDDRDMTDYVACLLAEFCSIRRAHNISGSHSKSYHYFTDLMRDFLDASSLDAFLIRSHVGNYALFMTGIFPDYIYPKATYGRKTPGFDYYEKMGSNSYRWASQHRLALRYSLVEILANLAERFQKVRIALNHLTDNYMVMSEKPDNLDKMLRQIFFDSQNPFKP